MHSCTRDDGSGQSALKRLSSWKVFGTRKPPIKSGTTPRGVLASNKKKINKYSGSFCSVVAVVTDPGHLFFYFSRLNNFLSHDRRPGERSANRDCVTWLEHNTRIRASSATVRLCYQHSLLCDPIPFGRDVEESTAAQCRHIFWMMEGKFEQTPQKKTFIFPARFIFWWDDNGWS